MSSEWRPKDIDRPDALQADADPWDVGRAPPKSNEGLRQPLHDLATRPGSDANVIAGAR